MLEFKNFSCPLKYIFMWLVAQILLAMHRDWDNPYFFFSIITLFSQQLYFKINSCAK